MRRSALTACALALIPHPAVAEPVTPPETARGNEPFWNAEVAGDALTLWRLDHETITLPVVVRTDATAASGTALTVLIAEDAGGANRFSLLLTGMLCHDSMSGMPYPSVAELTLGEEVLTGCAGDPRDLLTASDWQIVSLGGTGPAQTATGATPILSATAVDLRFEPGGALSGSGGCNRMMTQYGLTGEGLTILPQIATTMMACPDQVMDQERQVHDALARATRFDITEEGALILIGPDDDLLLTAEPAEPADEG